MKSSVIFRLLAGLIAGLCVPTALHAYEEPVADQGIYLNLNQEGLNFLSAEIKSRVLSPVRDLPLPDIKTRVDYGIDVRASGLKLSLDFTGLSISPAENRLAVSIGVRNITIDIPKIRASKKVIWEISTTCRNTRIKIGHQNALEISSDIPLRVEDGQIQLSLENTVFRIPDQEFDADGPESCSGALGIGNLIRSIVSNILDDSKDTIRRAVVDNIGKLSPVLAQELNNMTHQQIDLSARPVPVLPALNGYLRLSPWDVRIDPGSMQVEFSLHAEAGMLSDKSNSYSASSYSLKDSVLLGHVGINPELIREVFQLWMHDNPEGFSLSRELLPDVAPLLDPATASAIWPELLALNPAPGDLRLKLEFGSVPAITFEDASDSFVLQSDAVVASLQIKSGVYWRPFYEMQMAITARPSLVLDGDILLFNMTEAPEYSMSGSWPDGHNPGSETVRNDLLRPVTDRVINGLYSPDQPLYMMFIPTIFTGNSYLYFDRLRYQAPYITVSVVETDSP